MAAGAVTTTQALNNGILGGYATYNGTDWATVGTNGGIAQYTGYTSNTYGGTARIGFQYNENLYQRFNYQAFLQSLSGLTNVVMMLFGPANGPNPVHVCFDNVRVVPK